MKNCFLLLLLVCPMAVAAQKSVYNGFPSRVWPRLYDITFTKERDKLGEYDRPVFSADVKALDGKAVVLPGYMVPPDNVSGSSIIMLSSMPLNACFFCGVGGPETVVEVRLKQRTSWIEKPIEVKGILRLNARDPDEMIYILEEAEILGPIEF